MKCIASFSQCAPRSQSLHPRRRTWCWILLALLLHLCSSPAQTPEQEPLDLFRAVLPCLRAAHPDGYNTPEHLRLGWIHFLETLALAKTAREMGCTDRPEIRYRIDQILAQELILRDAESTRPVHSISEEDIDAHLSLNPDQFEIQAMMSVHEIVIRFDPASEADRAGSLGRAKRVHEYLGADPVTLERFADAPRTLPDGQSVQPDDGHVGVFSIRALATPSPPMSPAAAQELLKKKQVGQVSGVYDFRGGYRIYRLSGYREPIPLTSAAVRDAVRRALYLEARDKRLRDLISRSGLDVGSTLDEHHVKELLALPLANRVEAAHLPPSPAGADIPLAGPVSANEHITR